MIALRRSNYVVAQLMIAGFSREQVATCTGVSEKTAQGYAARTARALGVKVPTKKGHEFESIRTSLISRGLSGVVPTRETALAVSQKEVAKAVERMRKKRAEITKTVEKPAQGRYNTLPSDFFSDQDHPAAGPPNVSIRIWSDK